MTAAGRPDAESGGTWLPLHEPWPPDPLPPAESPPLVRLSVEGGRLTLAIDAPRPALGEESYSAPGFAGDLWRADCGELFLGAAGDGRYLEVNLGPRGAWWAGKFDGPRVRCAGSDPPPESLEVRTAAAIRGDRWRGSWSASLAALAGWLGAGPDLTANATCVVGAGGSRRFFSLCPLPPGGPDFHHPECWPPLSSESGTGPVRRE